MSTTPDAPVLSGVDLIAAERLRQQRDEGFDAAFDADHDLDELATAAMCYACPPNLDMRQDLTNRHGDPIPPTEWPWNLDSWKPSTDDRVRELVKAGALIAAEIDRIQAAPAISPHWRMPEPPMQGALATYYLDSGGEASLSWHLPNVEGAEDGEGWTSATEIPWPFGDVTVTRTDLEAAGFVDAESL